MIKSFFNKTLYNKLLLAFIVVGLLPFALFYFYILYWGEAKIIQRIIEEQTITLDKIIYTIDSHLLSLNKELQFISQLDVMDDIVSEDIDKRIARLLEQKKEDIGMDVSLFVVDTTGTKIASSQNYKIESKFHYFSKLITKKRYFIVDKNLYLFSNIFASFDKNKFLGSLVLKYNLENLDHFLIHRKGIHSMIINAKGTIYIGDRQKFTISENKNSYSAILSEHLLTYKRLPNQLNKYYAVYAVDKSIALSFLYDLLYMMLYIVPLALIIIVSVGIISSRKIVQPLLHLTSSAELITQTKDYTQKVNLDSQDEIGRLSYAFNELLDTTNRALESLEQENKLRLKRFIELTEIFSTIIQTKDENECISTSIQEMQKLSGNEKLHFIQTQKTSNNVIALYVDNFENDEKVYLGGIEIDADKMQDENEEKFYRSIVSMIILQLERIRLVEKTMQASRAKSAFISNMSHELRTPLNAIIGFTQFILVYEELKEDQVEMIANIESAAQYLLEMINGILDIAKIEAGKMEIYSEEVNLKKIVQSAYNMLQPLAEDKGLAFHLKMDGYTLQKYKTDPKIFQQIVTNLLSNAIKFTQKGSVNIQLWSKNHQVCISVKDTGIGIKKEDLTKLFGDFTQVENVMQKKHKGTGLGLSLSKKMAIMLGGDIKLNSDGLDKGTEIYFCLSTTAGAWELDK